MDKRIAIPYEPNGATAAQSDGNGVPSAASPKAGAVLTSRDVEAIAEATARKIIEIAREPAKTFGLVDARELAGELGVSPHYVYAHAPELGAMRLGLGPKARIRFDLDRARQALEARSVRPAKRRAR